MTDTPAPKAPEWVLVKEATPCDGCEQGICHNHGRYHIPGCWPCVWATKHEVFRCLCDRIGSS